MAENDVNFEPCWEQLSREFAAVVQIKGPVLLGDIARAYASVHRSNFQLHGHQLKCCLQRGQLPSVRYDERTKRLCLVENAGGDGTSSKKASSASTKTTRRAAPTEKSGHTTARITKPSGTSKVEYSGPTKTGKTATTRDRYVGTTKEETATPPSGPSEYIPSYFLVDSTNKCNEFVGPSLKLICTGHAIALQLEGRRLGADGGEISIIKIAGSWSMSRAAFMFDVAALERTPAGHKLLRDQLLPFLEDEGSTKVVHDFTISAIALKRHFGDALKIGRPLDTQFALEALQGDIGGTIGSAIKVFTGTHDLFSDAAFRATAFDHMRGSSLPISSHELNRAARTVNSLAKAGESIMTAGQLTEDKLTQVLQASKLKIDFAMHTLDNSRWMAFRNKGRCWGGGVGRKMVSYELQKVGSPTAMPATSVQTKSMLQKVQGPVGGGGVETLFPPKPPQQQDAKPVTFLAFVGRLGAKPNEKDEPTEDVNCPLDVLQLVPEAFLAEHLTRRHKRNLKDLQEIVLDEGRRPRALLQGRGRLFLCSDENRLVTAKDLKKVVGRLDLEGKFGQDNRAGFPGQLHRLSVMRRKQNGEIYAATLRIGRFFKGSAGLIDDILFHVMDVPGKPQRAASILVLGEAGSGKTTVIRDVCRKISATQTVVIVDTSNEIAGDGNIPHGEAIGESRRIMVPIKAEQHKVMTEALQNHTPQTIVVDEISNNLEARACLDIKARGVRLVASAHGDLQSLLKNPNLNTLLGGTTSVTIGDKAAEDNGGNKVLTQRAGAPVFDMAIEIKRGEVGTWTIIRNVAVAVDALLEGVSYEVERRSRSDRDPQSANKDADSEDGAFRLAYGQETERATLLF